MPYSNLTYFVIFLKIINFIYQLAHNKKWYLLEIVYTLIYL